VATEAAEAAPSLASPKGVVRASALAFASDKLYRRVVYVNVAFLAALIVINYILVLPQALEPFAAVLLYAPLAMGQWRFWAGRKLDTGTALTFVRLHRRAFKDRSLTDRLENPDAVRGDHFRVSLRAPLTLRRAAVRASYLYTIGLTIGVIFSTLFLPIAMGAATTPREFAIRSTSVAFLTAAAAFALAWIIPPIWLIEDSGVRYFSRKSQTVESVSKWYLTQLAPILGTGAIGTFFLIYWVAGFTLFEAILGLMQLSFSLYPASLTATFLYHKFREEQAVAEVKAALQKDGMVEFPTIVTALVRLPPK
jgi:hypothetical protein